MLVEEGTGGEDGLSPAHPLVPALLSDPPSEGGFNPACTPTLSLPAPAGGVFLSCALREGLSWGSVFPAGDLPQGGAPHILSQRRLAPGGPGKEGLRVQCYMAPGDMEKVLFLSCLSFPIFAMQYVKPNQTIPVNFKVAKRRKATNSDRALLSQ